MKRAIIYALVSVFIVFAFGFAAGVIFAHFRHKCPEPVAGKVIVHEPLSGWDILTLAIIRTESRYDSTAVGKDGLDRGVLQIRPVYVEECNNILGIDKYCHDDAFSVRKSLEMFCIIQEHYNPEHDIDRAIMLHNPKATESYKAQVLRNFRELVKLSEIIDQL